MTDILSHHNLLSIVEALLFAAALGIIFLVILYKDGQPR